MVNKTVLGFSQRAAQGGRGCDFSALLGDPQTWWQKRPVLENSWGFSVGGIFQVASERANVDAGVLDGAVNDKVVQRTKGFEVHVAAKHDGPTGIWILGVCERPAITRARNPI